MVFSNRTFRYTSKQAGKTTTVYAVILNSLARDFVVLGAPKLSNTTKVSILGYENDVEWDTLFTGELIVTIPRQQDLPEGAEWGFTVKLENLQPTSDTPTKPAVLPRGIQRPTLPHKNQFVNAWKKTI